MSKTSKLSYLEGLRGVAALVVALHHYVAMCFNGRPELESNIIFHMLSSGNLSVTLFFLISGRVLTLSLLKEERSGNYIKKISGAVFKRIFRLSIPVLGILVLSIALQSIGAYRHVEQARQIMSGGDSEWFRTPKTFGSFGELVIFLIDFLTNQLPDFEYYPLGVSWTIPIELSASWLLFLLTIATANIYRYLIPLLFALTLFFWYINSWNTLFVAGLLIANISVLGGFKRYCQNPRVWLLRIVLFIIAIFSLFPPVSDWINVIVQIQYYNNILHPSEGSIGTKVIGRWFEPNNAFIVSAVCIILLFEITPTMQILLSSAPFQFLGQISFGLYLGHPIVLLTVISPLIVFLDQCGLNYTQIALINYPIYLCMALSCGFLFHLIFDNPAIKFANYLAHTLEDDYLPLHLYPK